MSVAHDTTMNKVSAKGKTSHANELEINKLLKYYSDQTKQEKQANVIT